MSVAKIILLSCIAINDYKRMTKLINLLPVSIETKKTNENGETR